MSSFDDVIYFDAEDIVGFRADVFDKEFQQAADRLRSREVLEGAVGRSRRHAHYAAADLASQAAVLAHGIAQGRPLIDGNKRTALVAVYTFLEVNGFALQAFEARLAGQIHRLSQDLAADELADRIRDSLIPATPE